MDTQSASEFLALLVDPNLARPTRIHPFPTAKEGTVFAKREDELSSSVPGSKLRKFASLLPALVAKEITVVGLIGGSHSNNIVGLIQLLKEKGMRPLLFLREAADPELMGNALFLDMLVDESAIIRIPRAHWENVEAIASEHLATVSSPPTRAFLVPEGALCYESLPGAVTLARDLLRNEHENELFFDQIYIDSGTGMSAFGLILGLCLLDPLAVKRGVKVTLIAGSEETFLANLAHFRRQLEEKQLLACNTLPKLQFLKPPTAAKFGDVNETVLAACTTIARSEGLLMDPVYSVKHYMAMQADLASDPSRKLSLFIYNGGALGLCGFQRQLASRRTRRPSR